MAIFNSYVKLPESKSPSHRKNHHFAAAFSELVIQKVTQETETIGLVEQGYPLVN